MIPYDRAQPLIFIHIPKTAGSSVRHVLDAWFGDNLHLHYPAPQRGIMPPTLDLEALHAPQHPVAVYGHFNKLRGFGVEQRYPRVRQFITILRDPWEQRLSGYSYMQSRSSELLLPDNQTQDDIRAFMLDTRLGPMTQFPRDMTHENYKSVIDSLFIEIGITEQLSASMRRIADKLGFAFDKDTLPHVNASKRADIAPDALRAEFRRVHDLEYRIYDYVRARYP